MRRALSQILQAVAAARRHYPWLLLALGAALHLHTLTSSTWAKVTAAPHARDFASYYYAAQAADRGEDPYRTRALNKLARRDPDRDDRRRGVHPFFYPPPFLLAMQWTLPLTLERAYRAWFILDSFFLLAALAALARWLPWKPIVLGSALILASHTAIHDNHWMGQANLPVLALTLWGLYLAEVEPPGRRGRVIAGGALVGLACMLKMSPGLLVAWWLLRRRWLAAGAACAAAVALSVASLPVLDLDGQLRFYREILPGFASGDYNGLKVSILLPGNHSLPNLWAMAYDAGATLEGPARRGASLSNLALVAAGAWALRRQTPDLAGAAYAAAAVSVIMLLVPVYTYEHHLSTAIFPALAAGAALASRRLGWGWAAACALAYVPLAWTWGGVRGLSRELGGIPGLLVQESKFAALVIFGLACAVAARRPDGAAGKRDSG